MQRPDYEGKPAKEPGRIARVIMSARTFFRRIKKVTVDADKPFKAIKDPIPEDIIGPIVCRKEKE